MIIEDVSV